MFGVDDICRCTGRLMCEMCENCFRYKMYKEDRKSKEVNYASYFQTPPATSDTECIYKL
jgi:hypothetical protein